MFYDTEIQINDQVHRNSRYVITVGTLEKVYNVSCDEIYFNVRDDILRYIIK